MSENADALPSLDALRERVVALAAMRFEKFYHHSTGTHIVRQLEGTEFRPSGVKGYGDFADEAYADYRSALTSYAARQDESRLRELEVRLGTYAPMRARKVELHVQLSQALTDDLKQRAKEINLSLGAYVNRLLDELLPHDLNEAVIAAWTAEFDRMTPTPAGASMSRRLQLTVPVAQQEFDRLGYFTDRMSAAGKTLTLDDAVSRLLMRPGTLIRPPQSLGVQPVVH